MTRDGAQLQDIGQLLAQPGCRLVTRVMESKVDHSGLLAHLAEVHASTPENTKEINDLGVQERTADCTNVRRRCTNTAHGKAQYDVGMFAAAFIAWLVFLAMLVRLGHRGREMFLLAAWTILAVSLVASLGRLLFS